MQKVELPINKTTYYKHAVSMRYPNMPLMVVLLLRLAASLSIYVPVDDGAMHTFLELGILLLICPIKLSLANKFINIKWMVVRAALCLHSMPYRLVLRSVVVVIVSWCSL